MTAPRNKDSMKSTWRYDKKQWSLDHHFLSILDPFDPKIDQNVPVHAKTEAVPYLTQFSCHVWILTHAAWPILIQYLSVYLTGENLSPLAAFFLYAAGFQLNAISQMRILRRFGHKYGFLDGDQHQRDGIPDVGVTKVLTSLVWTTTVRPLFTLIFTYDSTRAPYLSWWLPLELILYPIVLDFWFYSYHRACHEINCLWKYHRTHHLTKHPNPMLSSYADTEQEIIEIAIVPILTWLTLRLVGFPMGFYDWWICHEYIIFIESFGHSGLRMYGTPPNPAAFLLKFFESELIIEDHDLHHRNGWRRSHNYGKQTRLWDRVFGTCGPRPECEIANVDMSQKIHMPLI